MLAIFQVLLYRYSGEADIIIGTAVSGRPQAEVSSAFGPFENHLPIRLGNDDNLTFAQLYAFFLSVCLSDLVPSIVKFFFF